jgi:hypothetical protein
MIKEELSKVMDEINEINSEIAHIKENEGDGINYVFYGDSMEEKANKDEEKDKGFYDSIVKQTKAAQFIEDEYIKDGGREIEYNYDNIYNKEESGGLTNEFIGELRNTADLRILSNRFLVDLNYALKIPEIMVKSVAFDTDYDRLSISIYDFITEYKGEKRPILDVLKNCAPNFFTMVIKHLDAEGKVMYTEKYSKCHLTEVFRDSLDYSSNEFSKIHVFISYQDVEYETSN